MTDTDPIVPSQGNDILPTNAILPNNGISPSSDIFADRKALLAALEEEHNRNVKMQHYAKALGMAFPLAIDIDYKNDTYEMVEYDNFLNKTADRAGNIDDLIRVGASTVPDEKIAKQFWDLFNREAVIASFREGKQVVELQHPQIGDDGKTHWMLTYAACTDFNDDEIKGMSFSRCIDDEIERNIAQALADEQLAVVEALSTICSVIMTGDLRTHRYKVIKCADAMKDVIGGGTEGDFDMAMLSIVENFIREDMRDEVREFLNPDTLDERMGNKNSISIDYATPLGRWLKGRFIVQTRDDAGHIEKVLYLAREFTDEKERELDYLDRLKSAAAEAERANRSKTDFLRRMSHDIRTPLNGIIGMLRIMDNNKGNKEKYEECIEKIFRSSDYLLSIVNDVLDVSKMETGGIELEHKPFDLGQLLLNTLPIVAANASQHHVLFSGGREDTHITHRYVVGSPVHLNRVLMNIASNAVKYNKRGGSLKIYCNELESDGEEAIYEFICEDTGQGMSEEFQKRAFEPLAREGKETTTGFSGSGLGLSIVKDIVTKMDGTIDLHSEENVGTTIRLVIPFELDKNYKHTEETPKLPEKLDLSGRSALLVEDNGINMEIARIMLEEMGLVVTGVENGKKAVDAFADSNPYTYDFIFMDMMMPVMDGLEATREIRSMKRADAATVPIIAMTANAFADDKHACLDAGMNEHIGKPIDVAEVVSTISKFVS